MIRVLDPQDTPELEHFLREHADSSLFLRSNVLAAGLRDQGKPLQATYVARWEGRRMTGVAAHCWNGNLLLQAPEASGALARQALATTGRALAGVVGPWRQVDETLNALGLQDAPTQLKSREGLFAMALASLQVPSPLSSGALSCRKAEARELDLLVDWRRGYRMEALGELDHAGLPASCREEVLRSHTAGTLFVLATQSAVVSTCAFNARHPDCVQIGGVWTPPSLRAKGYGRAVVAGALLIARSEGVGRSVLFTGEENVPAQTAYTSLGFRRVGDYGLVLFRGSPQVETSTGRAEP